MVDLERTVYKDFQAWKSSPGNRALFVEGARQVGKTYIVNKFARENYKQIIYINLMEDTGQKLLKCYEKLKAEIDNNIINVVDETFNFVYELIKLYTNNFIDNNGTVIIIDEIQESSEIFNKIRNFSRNLNSDIIVTGSYLGRVMLGKGFKYSAGDYETIEVRSLSFEEFLNAFNLLDLYNSLDLSGNSEKKDYDLISKYFKIYLTIGGFPAIVKEYKETNDTKKCGKLLQEIVDIYCSESGDYFDDIEYKSIFEQSLTGIAKTLANEKKGLKGYSLNEILQKINIQNNSTNISKSTYGSVMSWLYKSKMIKYCGKAIECNMSDIIENQRGYFNDLGITNYLLTLARVSTSDRAGILHESFVFDCLERNFIYSPAFATLGNGELDFIHLSYNDNKIYGIEVKAGNNVGKTITQALSKGKINYALYVKGDSYGGINDKGTTITIPIYLFPRFNFNLGENDNQNNKTFNEINIF